MKESHIDFAKLFRTLKLPQLKKLVFTDTKKLIEDVDMRALVVSCKGITHLNFTHVSSLDNELIKMAIEGLPLLDTFILLRNINVNNEIFIYLANSCQYLKHLELGGLPTEFNNNITFEGIEGMTHMKSKLKRIKFEYCAKIGDMSV
jgi:hypothetical protein